MDDILEPVVEEVLVYWAIRQDVSYLVSSETKDHKKN